MKDEISHDEVAAVIFDPIQPADPVDSSITPAIRTYTSPSLMSEPSLKDDF